MSVTIMKLQQPEPAAIPGLIVTGYAKVGPNNWLPLYDSAPTEGQGIHTPEGWNALAERSRHDNRVPAE